jgi:hypothetical protein
MKVTNPKGIIMPNWLELISAPVSKDRIKWKIQTTQKEGKYQMLVCYFDKRDAIDRLNDALGGHWSDQYNYSEEVHMKKGKPTTHYVIECVIRVEFATHVIHRSAACEAADIEGIKSSRSNSLKLAAGMFGFGSELYEFPKVYVESVKKGQYTNQLVDKKKLDKALDIVYDIHLNSGVQYPAVWIDGKGDVYAVNDFHGKGVLLQKLNAKKKTTPTVKKDPPPVVEDKFDKQLKSLEKFLPDNDPKLNKKIAALESKDRKHVPVTKKPELQFFPTYSTTNADGGLNWQRAIQAWKGGILKSKAKEGEEPFFYVVLNGYMKNNTAPTYHKLTKAQYQQLIVHAKYIK